MSEMTPCQRVLAALKCQETDRVPFLETVIDETIALPLLGRTLPAHVSSVEIGTGGDAVLTGSLLGSPRYQPFELVENLGLDGFGTYIFARTERIEETVDGHTMVSGGTLKTRSDLGRIQLADPHDPAIYVPFQKFIDQHHASGRALFCFLNLGSDPVVLGMGFETFSTMLYDDRVFVEELFDLYTSWYASVVSHLCELDFDFLWFGDDIAFKTQPYVSPRMFRQIFMPYYRRVADQISKPWIFHSDGNLMPILDDLLGLGMSGLHPIEPDAMDLGALKQRYVGRLCLVGGIDLDTLCRGTPSQVDALVKDAIQIAAPGGGYIAGSSNSIPYYARPENVRAMAKAIQSYGRNSEWQ